MKQGKIIFSVILMLILGLSFAACSDDDNSSSPLVGTWTRQIQWAGTNGTRDHSFTFKADGTGTHKQWDWLDQKYYYYKFKWSANSTTIAFQYGNTENSGVTIASGTMYYTLTGNCLTLYHGDGSKDGDYFKK